MSDTARLPIWSGRHRVKVDCPGCGQSKNAIWHLEHGCRILRFATHRHQRQLAAGERPARCLNSGRAVHDVLREVAA